MNLIFILLAFILFASTSGSWHLLPTIGKVPDARYEHAAAVTDDNSVLIFGGLTFVAPQYLPNNELWSFVNSTWELIPPVDVVPEPRGYSSLTAIGKNQYLLFGGKTEPPNEKYFSDTWIVTLDLSKGGILRAFWKQLKTDVSPPGRFFHRAVSVGDTAIIFGGAETAATVVVNDVWQFRNLTWTCLFRNSSMASAPAPRQGHSMVPFNDGFVLFGGRPGVAKLAYDDVWVFSASKGWTMKGQGTIPARASHSAVLMGSSNMVVFAGSIIEKNPPYVEDFHNDVWVYDLLHFNWQKLQDDHPDDGSCPWKRKDHSAVYAANQMITFGGYGLYQGLRNDLWAFSP